MGEHAVVSEGSSFAGTGSAFACGACGVQAVREGEGSPVSPYIGTYTCEACGWAKLRCGKTRCGGYMESEPSGAGTRRYTCVDCGWTGTGPTWDEEAEGIHRPEPMSTEVPPRPDVEQAEIWYQKAFDAVFSGFDLEHEYYVKALECDPTTRKAWYELGSAARAAGRIDVLERCDRAMGILDGGGTITDCHDVLG